VGVSGGQGVYAERQPGAAHAAAKESGRPKRKRDTHLQPSPEQQLRQRLIHARVDGVPTVTQLDPQHLGRP